MAVWVAYISEGSYSDASTNIEGVFKTKEGALLRGKALIERKVAEAEEDLLRQQDIVSGETPFDFGPQDYQTRWGEQRWRTYAAEAIPYCRQIIDSGKKLLDSGPFEQSIVGLPEGSVFIADEEAQWWYNVVPFEVQE